MKLKNLLVLNAMAAMLAACGGGDVNLNPSTSVTDSNNTVNNPPASTPAPAVSSVTASSIASVVASSADSSITSSTYSSNVSSVASSVASSLTSSVASSLASSSSSSVLVAACASYTQGGQTFHGTLSGANCTYPAAFASDSKQLTVNLAIPELPNGGVHIFQDALFIGEDVDNNAATGGKRIPQDGEGVTLTVAAGAKIAFENGTDYLRIARGSRIVANGTKDKPIIFSAVKDLVEKTATVADRGLWGGIQINGNGLSNKCTDAQRAATGNNVHSCHLLSEGLPGTYGGGNNAESSGSLQYVVIKHAGYKVVEGNELNALTLNAVGSGTVIDHVQSYAAQDDAFEWFGGAVNAKHLVAVATSDDGFDFTDGYVGHIQYALSVALNGVGGNNCIEADNAGASRADNIAPLTKVRISNLTCVTNNLASNSGTVPSPDGNSQGALIREGFFIELYNSILTSNASGMVSRSLLTFTDTSGPYTIKAATDGWSAARSNLVAGTTPAVQNPDPENGAFTTLGWLADTNLNSNNVVVNAANQLPVSVLKDLATSDKAYLTLPTIADATTAPISIALFDVSKLADLVQPNVGAVPAAGTSTFFVNPTHLGAASETNDWVAGWTVGLQ